MRPGLKPALVVLVLAPVLASAATWEIDPAHSAASFGVRHIGVATVLGDFGKVTGMVAWDEADVTRSSVEATIDVTSLSTGEPRRDEHLRSADFLDAQRFPTMGFRSTRVERAGASKLKVTGLLTIKGISRQVVLDVRDISRETADPWGNVKRGLTATFTLNRQDFDVRWDRRLADDTLVVGNEVHVTLDIELVKRRQG